MKKSELIREATDKFKIIKDKVQIKVADADKAINWYKSVGSKGGDIKKIDDKTVEVSNYDLVKYAVNNVF